MKVCGKLCDTNEPVTITLSGGSISSVEHGMEAGALGGEDVFLSSGFFDLQVNGYGGYDFNIGVWGEKEEISNELEPLFRKLAQSGTALFCPTLTTNSHQSLIAGFSSLSKSVESDKRMSRAAPAFHLEGPFISREDGPRGAHPLEYVRAPDWEEFQRLQEAAGGRIRLCTLAPEWEGGLRFIEKLTASGVVAAIGHTGAEPARIRDAVLAGARLSTHLGNGSHALIQRHPNYIWEQLAEDQLYATVISDGFHLPPSVLKSFLRVKGKEKTALASDAVSLGGLTPGRYASGRYEVLPGGKVVTAGTPYLAGSGHLLNTCIPNMVRYTDLTLAQAVCCASAIPARILNLDERKGRIQVGCDADITLFQTSGDDPLKIIATICGGQVLFRRESNSELE